VSEMVEQVARAISDARQVRAYGRVLTMWRAPEMSESIIEERLGDARAAIAAMREPTQAMIEAAYNEVGQDTDHFQIAAAWQAMIDEMLK
jgi:hypothetical protein